MHQARLFATSVRQWQKLNINMRLWGSGRYRNGNGDGRRLECKWLWRQPLCIQYIHIAWEKNFMDFFIHLEVAKDSHFMGLIFSSLLFVFFFVWIEKSKQSALENYAMHFTMNSTELQAKIYNNINIQREMVFRRKLALCNGCEAPS